MLGSLSSGVLCPEDENQDQPITSDDRAPWLLVYMLLIELASYIAIMKGTERNAMERENGIIAKENDT